MDTIEEYVQWILKSLETYKKLSEDLSLIADNDKLATLQDINKILKDISKSRIGISGEKFRYFRKLKEKSLNFEIWWAKKYTEKRLENNKEEKAGNKWISKGEIDNLVINEFEDTYREYKFELIDLETKVDYLENSLKDIDKLIDICEQLSNNLRKEIDLLSKSGGGF